MNTIVIIEDEKDLAELIAFNLEKEGHKAFMGFDGPAGVELVRDLNPDLVLLDLMIPKLSGIEVCKLLKGGERTSHIPIIMLTAKGEEIDRVVGFEVGADDYVVKPFSVRELLLRVKAVLRRAGPERGGDTIIKAGPVTIDTTRYVVLLNDEEIAFTTTEFKLLLTLAQRMGRVQSREQLLRDVWGMSYMGDTRTVDTHITRLRTKLGDAGETIKTVRGFGYKMEAE